MKEINDYFAEVREIAKQGIDGNISRESQGQLFIAGLAILHRLCLDINRIADAMEKTAVVPWKERLGAEP